jgi:hypothetical protein
MAGFAEQRAMVLRKEFRMGSGFIPPWESVEALTEGRHLATRQWGSSLGPCEGVEMWPDDNPTPIASYSLDRAGWSHFLLCKDLVPSTLPPGSLWILNQASASSEPVLLTGHLHSWSLCRAGQRLFPVWGVTHCSCLCMEQLSYRTWGAG